MRTNYHYAKYLCILLVCSLSCSFSIAKELTSSVSAFNAALTKDICQQIHHKHDALTTTSKELQLLLRGLLAQHDTSTTAEFERKRTLNQLALTDDLVEHYRDLYNQYCEKSHTSYHVISQKKYALETKEIDYQRAQSIFELKQSLEYLKNKQFNLSEEDTKKYQEKLEESLALLER